MKERLMIVEDQLINMLGALIAFNEGGNIEVGDVHATIAGALKMIDEFKPTVALLDIHLKDGLSTEVAKVLDEKSIPYLYVTGVGDLSHGRIDAIEIQDKNFKTIESFDSIDKGVKIWQKAFEILKERKNL